MISKELQQKLDFYEQVYFGLDKPIPFKGGLTLYPVKVKDYYEFYSSLPCLTMDKNVMTIIDESGRPKKVSNAKGISQSYLAYLIDKMESESQGDVVTEQVVTLFELIFHIKRGFYCPHCHKEVTYQDALKNMEQYIKSQQEEAQKIYSAQFRDDGHIIPEDIMHGIIEKSKTIYLSQLRQCECGSIMRDTFSIKDDNGFKKLVVKDVEIGTSDMDELKALVPRQNILNYDGDKYVDADLKEELEIKAKLQNQDYTSPTLEKQMICVAVSTGYSLEYLESMSMRKLSYFLKVIDNKNSYYAQYQASLSGMVTFKEPPKHWIFTNDKKNIKDELTSLENFEKKFEHVT